MSSGERASAADGANDADARNAAEFTRLLAALRALPGPCAPPVGVGAFDILFASSREVVVWYAPARDGLEQREVAIPCDLVRASWALVLRGAPVDEEALRTLASSAAHGRWLFALLAQVPGVDVEESPSTGEIDGGGETAPQVTLVWRGGRRGRRSP